MDYDTCPNYPGITCSSAHECPGEGHVRCPFNQYERDQAELKRYREAAPAKALSDYTDLELLDELTRRTGGTAK
jgi:hypothetical protein